MEGIFEPEWPAPPNVQAVITTRRGGASEGPWSSFNMGVHVGDDQSHVSANRNRLRQAIGLAPEQVHWMEQVHGTRLVRVPPMENCPEADAAWTDLPGNACVVMTADCLPVLFCDRNGERVAVAHAGWRGLADGILEKTLSVFSGPANVLAYLGPAIGPQAFEVGPEVRARFLAGDEWSHIHFTPGAPSDGTDGGWYADLYGLARQRLSKAGLSEVYGGDFCTYRDEDDFYSYRRDGTTGRMASLIWLDRAPGPRYR